MKKIIALVLSIITIIICGWLVIKRMELLDIPSNKNDENALYEKIKIDTRTDINECEKKILKNQIDFERKKERQISNIAFSTQFIALVIIVIQLILMVIILMMPKKVPEKTKNE